jgi:hypothetical protein
MGLPDVLVQPDVFVVPIAGTRRDGTPHTDTDVREFRDPTGEYRDRWDVLGLDVPAKTEPGPRAPRQGPRGASATQAASGIHSAGCLLLYVACSGTQNHWFFR